ncbi:MAG: hexitol phosphatase HxpB [Bacteroidetes bacterium]|nr:hexitol phosphatase HxpB [Bacteroidota bacterium]
MIDAVIFDMDGILINSEPLWKKAEKEVFGSVGVEITEELSKVTASMITTEVTQFWYSHSPWVDKSLEQVENEVIDLVENLIIEEGKSMEGVIEILEFLKKRNLKIGLSTNSPFKLIPVVLNKVGIADFFDAVSSAEHELQGKPNPAVFLSTARKLGILPTKCIVFEDSLSGIIAAKKANMKTVAILPDEEFHSPKFNLSDIKLNKLNDFNDKHLEYFLKKENGIS